MLRVHFLNVGHGDCTIIKHPSGRLTVIDINNSQEYDEDSFKEFMKEQTNPRNYLASLLGGSLKPSLNNALLGFSPPKDIVTMLREQIEAKSQAQKELTDPVAFLQNNYPGQSVWRFVLTHPDLDHMRGIKNLHDAIGFSNFWDTNHTKPAPVFRSDADKMDWEFYQKLRSGNTYTAHRFYMRGDSFFAFGKDENGQSGGDSIEILSPTTDLVRSCNEAGKSNSLSLVIRVKHAGKSVLLPGDAEDDAWDNMSTFYGAYLKSDFLKASHHGRETGYNLKAVRLISPTLTFVSVGRKPDTDASSKYRQQCHRVASTRYHGNIEVRIHDNGQHEWFVDRNWG